MDVCFISLGCDKNLVDTEYMLAYLANKGYRLVFDEQDADIIVINTCCFVNEAKEENIRVILQAAGYKKSGKLKALIVAGCLAQLYKDEILEEIGEIDALIGTTGYQQIVGVIESVLHGNGRNAYADVDDLVLPDVRRVNTTAEYLSYLKIAEGCDRHCTYCIIPSIRGRYRSVPMERLVDEAGYLADGGVRELVVIAQETTLYGIDLYGRKRLPELLRKLCGIPGIGWVRLMYCYPEEVTDELIEVIKNEPKMCHYLDMPIQHASDSILRKMGRHTTGGAIRDLINKLRAEIPDIALRTTLITGFPSETEGDHGIMKAFVGEMEFDRLGVFTYSREEGTAAAKMKGRVPKKVMLQRFDDLMTVQQRIAFKKAKDNKSRVLSVIIENKAAKDKEFVGRTYMDAPKVDGLIYVHSERGHMQGDFVKAKVTGTRGYDLVAKEVKDESAK